MLGPTRAAPGMTASARLWTSGWQIDRGSGRVLRPGGGPNAAQTTQHTGSPRRPGRWSDVDGGASAPDEVEVPTPDGGSRASRGRSAMSRADEPGMTAAGSPSRRGCRHGRICRAPCPGRLPGPEQAGSGRSRRSRPAVSIELRGTRWAPSVVKSAEHSAAGCRSLRRRTVEDPARSAGERGSPGSSRRSQATTIAIGAPGAAPGRVGSGDGRNPGSPGAGAGRRGNRPASRSGPDRTGGGADARVRRGRIRSVRRSGRG